MAMRTPPKRITATKVRIVSGSSIDILLFVLLRDVMDRENVIAVTHEALVYDIIDKFTNGREQGLDRSHYVQLEKRGNGLYVTRAGKISEGNSRVNILI